MKFVTNPDDRRVRFGGHLDDSWFGGQDDIVEDVVVLQNFFHVIREDAGVGLFG